MFKSTIATIAFALLATTSATALAQTTDNSYGQAQAPNQNPAPRPAAKRFAPAPPPHAAPQALNHPAPPPVAPGQQVQNNPNNCACPMPPAQQAFVPAQPLPGQNDPRMSQPAVPQQAQTTPQVTQQTYERDQRAPAGGAPTVAPAAAAPAPGNDTMSAMSADANAYNMEMTNEQRSNSDFDADAAADDQSRADSAPTAPTANYGSEQQLDDQASRMQQQAPSASLAPQAPVEMSSAGSSTGSPQTAEQQTTETVQPRDMVIPPAASQKDQASTQQKEESVAASDLRAPSPRLTDPNRKDYIQVGLGPAYGIGWASDSLMYNVTGSYNWNLNDDLVAKAIGDLFNGTGTVGSRLANFSGGAEYYIPGTRVGGSPLYVGANLGIGFGRNARQETGVGLTAGASTGFKFKADDLNYDVSLNYSLLTANIGNTNPSVIGARLSMNF